MKPTNPKLTVDVSKAHEFDSIVFQRGNLPLDESNVVVIGCNHSGQTGTEQIGIKDSHLVAQSLEAVGQADAGGTLADASLARRYGDDVFHARKTRGALGTKVDCSWHGIVAGSQQGREGRGGGCR